MKKFIKENWFKVAVLLVMVSLFYWYEWRPSEIKKNCHETATIPLGKRSLESFAITQGLYEEFYQKCLRKNGL